MLKGVGLDLKFRVWCLEFVVLGSECSSFFKIELLITNYCTQSSSSIESETREESYRTGFVIRNTMYFCVYCANVNTVHYRTVQYFVFCILYFMSALHTSFFRQQRERRERWEMGDTRQQIRRVSSGSLHKHCSLLD